MCILIIFVYGVAFLLEKQYSDRQFRYGGFYSSKLYLVCIYSSKLKMFSKIRKLNKIRVNLKIAW